MVYYIRKYTIDINYMRISTLFFAIGLFFASLPFAQAEDTLKVSTHARTHLKWYGGYKQTNFFPTKGKEYRAVNMRYTIGCPDKGCSEWDYTTNILVNHKTGNKDSTLVQRSSLYNQSTAIDSFKAVLHPYFDSVVSAGVSSKVEKASVKLYFYNDSLMATTITDSLEVWSQGWSYTIVDGVKTDSSFVNADTVFYAKKWPFYNVFDQIIKYEIGRLITPYAGGFTKAWQQVHYFDVTDYAMLLQDSVEIEVFYSGYQDGFTVSLDFDFIEGKAPRKVKEIVQLYRGSFPYGNPNNSIENYLPERKLFFDAQNKSAKFIVIQTGHGFGGNENCAEFCPKYHYVKVNGEEKYRSLIWRENCGLNAMFPQPGTWLYDRANWCPGDLVKPFEYELTDFLTPGDSFSLNLDIEPFTNNGNNSCSYIIAGQVVFYEEPKILTDIGIIEVVAPNKDFRFNRQNPNCFAPIIRVKNFGNKEVSSIEFTYGVAGGKKETHTWQGLVKIGEEKDIELWQPQWSSSNADRQFECEISKVNGYESDMNPQNNTLSSSFDLTPTYPNKLIVQIRTNNFPDDNTLKIVNSDGNVYFEKKYTAGNTLYRDTISLPSGCFRFSIDDKNKNGLGFWAFSAGGTGSLQLRGPNSELLQNIAPDFGTSVEKYFMVGYAMDVQQIQSSMDLDIQVYPNPSNGNLVVDYANFKEKISKLELYNTTGLNIGFQSSNTGSEIHLKTNAAKGIYFLHIHTESQKVVKKIVIE